MSHQPPVTVILLWGWLLSAMQTRQGESSLGWDAAFALFAHPVVPESRLVDIRWAVGPNWAVGPMWLCWKVGFCSRESSLSSGVAGLFAYNAFSMEINRRHYFWSDLCILKVFKWPCNLSCLKKYHESWKSMGFTQVSWILLTVKHFCA